LDVKIEPNTNNHLSKTSTADCFQIRSIFKERFIKKVGELRKEEIQEIENILVLVLNIGN
jgi:mRNA interferase MazF